MSHPFKAFFLSLTVIAMLLLSAVGTVTVRADDGSGSETSEAETTLPTEESQPSEGETEAANSDEEAPPADAVQTETSDVVLEQVPENTTLTVLDSSGEPLPLVSQEAADAIASAYDPIWCPATQTTPTPGQNGCTESYNSFTELLTFLKENEGDAAYQQAGTIYIQKDQYLGGESSVDFNDYNFNTINNYNLTLQGGWDTTDNSVDAADTTQFNVPITIGSSLNPWVGSLTINNISISGVSGETGLTLFSQNNINLSNVEVTNSQSGANLQANGAVQVTDSSFNNNANDGLRVVTNNEVSLVNVKADGNQRIGAHIEALDVAIDTASFSNNSVGGLEATSQNAVALFAVTANNNRQFGANIFAGNLVAIAQSNFNNGGGYGLNVVTTGLISVENVNANNNIRFGASLQGGDTVVSNSFFTANGSGIETAPTSDGYGLKVVSTGKVDLAFINDADSVGNQIFGADITAAGMVTVTNSFFSGHHSEIFDRRSWTTDYYGYGLTVVTPDDIFLNYVVGNDNNLWGASLTGNNVAVYNSQFNNNITESVLFIDDTGLLVFAGGIVDLFNVEAKENRLIGAIIEADGDVFVTNGNFSDNQGVTCMDNACQVFENHGEGLIVTTSSNIFVNGITANNNLLIGASLTGVNVEVSNSTFDSNGREGAILTAQSAVTVTDSTFTNNGENGLAITAPSGDVTLNVVNASNNGQDGVNVAGACANSVLVNGGNFSNNDRYGLMIDLSTLVLDGTQTLAGNGVSDVFTNSDTCPPVESNSGDNNTPPVNNDEPADANAPDDKNGSTPTDTSTDPGNTTVGTQNAPGAETHVGKKFDKSSDIKKGVWGKIYHVALKVRQHLSWATDVKFQPVKPSSFLKCKPI